MRPGHISFGLAVLVTAILSVVGLSGFLTALFEGSDVSTWLAVLVAQGPITAVGAILMIRASGARADSEASAITGSG